MAIIEVFFAVDEEKTTRGEIEAAFKDFTSRKGITVVLVTQVIANNDIRHLINDYTQAIPAVLEIPSKDFPYDETKDPIMQRVLALIGGGRDAGELGQGA